MSADQIDQRPSFFQFENEKIVAPLAKDLLRRTRPVYLLPQGRSERDMLTVGSGFFLRYRNRTVFVTAAHVVRETRNGLLYVPTVDRQIESFGGAHFCTGRRGAPEEEDRIDLGFVQVPGHIAGLLPPDDYFTSSDWTMADRYHQHSAYLVCGWPAKRNQPDPRHPKILPRAPISHLDYRHPPAYVGKYGLHPRAHLGIRFDPKRALDDRGALVNPPSLKGVSGSPCFFFHRYASRDDIRTVRRPKLVGVAIECQRDCIIATRISILLQLIERQLDSLDGRSPAENVSIRL